MSRERGNRDPLCELIDSAKRELEAVSADDYQKIAELRQVLDGISMEIDLRRETARLSNAASPLRGSRKEVARALYSSRLLEIRSVKGWEIFDGLVIDWRVGKVPSTEDQWLLETLVRGQPKVVANVGELQKLIVLRVSGQKGAVAEMTRKIKETAAQCIEYWEKILNKKNHRPTDREMLEKDAEATRLNEGGMSVSRIALSMFPHNAEGTIDALKTRIARFKKARQEFLDRFASESSQTASR